MFIYLKGKSPSFWTNLPLFDVQSPSFKSQEVDTSGLSRVTINKHPSVILHGAQLHLKGHFYRVSRPRPKSIFSLACVINELGVFLEWERPCPRMQRSQCKQYGVSYLSSGVHHCQHGVVSHTRGFSNKNMVQYINEVSVMWWNIAAWWSWLLVIAITLVLGFGSGGVSL